MFYNRPQHDHNRVSLGRAEAKGAANQIAVARRLWCLMCSYSAAVCWLVLGLLVTHPLITHGTEEDQQRAVLKGMPIQPSSTDAAIQTFDSSHYFYVNRDIVISHKPELPEDRHELVLWLTGTGGQGKGAAKFCELAAKLGYHVISLMYPNEIPAAICSQDSNPAAFEDFRMAIIAGGTTPYITIGRADSIENRLIKLLLSLKQYRPREHWDYFLNKDGGIKWDSLVVAGHSQGGGHAALIAIKHHVARVICIGAPKDYSVALNKPAVWYSQKSATPKSYFFAFNHQKDFQGCTPDQQSENLRALGLDKLGAPADVDTESPPYHHSRILTSNLPGGTMISLKAHNFVIDDKNDEVFGKAWKYMLTEKIP